MKKRTILMASLTLLFFISCGGDTSGGTSGGNKLKVASGDSIYFGAFPDFGGSEDKVSKARIEAFQNIVGKKIGWAYFSQNWYKGIVYPQAYIHTIYDSGVVPFIRLMPRSDEIQGHVEKIFSLQNIINGNFDDELKTWAQAAIADGIPLLVDFAVEPNGNWFQWSGVFNGGAKTDGYGDSTYPDGPERYRDAYRHIIDLFRAEGVQHITWFFHFNYASYPNVAWNKPSNYYPGDDYIDWIGTSLYGAQESSEEWAGLAFSTQLELYASDAKAVSSTKPMALLEFGVTDHHAGGNKSVWLHDAFSNILANPYIQFDAISPWHENWENEDGTFSTLRLDSSSEALATFRKEISNERFISELRF